MSRRKACEIGVQGIQLKQYEQVVKNLLSFEDIRIEYCALPPRPSSNSNNHHKDWPFNLLPPQARVWGPLPGQLGDRKRAQRKEDQLRCMILCVLALLHQIQDNDESLLLQDNVSAKATETKTTRTLVDFGGGSGHLAIPLALLLPTSRVIVVDLSETSLNLLHEKARNIPSSSSSSSTTGKSSDNDDDPRVAAAASSNFNSKFRSCPSIPNLYTFHGAVEAFLEETAKSTLLLPSFDIGMALHLCGQATDVALRTCGLRNAKALVVCPCCVGKLNTNRSNPYIYQATGDNRPTVQYPQSTTFQTCPDIAWDDNDNNINNSHDNSCWNALAKAADYGELPQLHTGRGAARRTAKSLLETDRRLFLEQTFGYQTAMTRMEPWQATPKHDILLAWKQNNAVPPPPWSCQTNPACRNDLIRTRQYLFGDKNENDAGTLLTTLNNDESNIQEQPSFKKMDVGGNGKQQQQQQQHDSVDWTAREGMEMRLQIQSFFAADGCENSNNDDDNNDDDDNSVLVFPTGMGARRRKLIHFVAEQLHLAHWSVGRRKTDKTVAVARQRKRTAAGIIPAGENHKTLGPE